MRRWLLFLMVLLLPLRGWVGDAMAGQMLAQHVHAAQAAHASGPHALGPVEAAAATHARHGHDCHELAAATPAFHAPDGVAPLAQLPAAPDLAGDCPTCASCQVCSAAALALPLPPSVAPLFGAEPPHAAELSFASAEPAPAYKPPIS